MRTWLRGSLLALSLAAVSTLSLVAEMPQASNPARGRKSDLERIRDEIRDLKANLEKVRSRTRSAEEDLQAADLELAIRTRELEIAISTQAGLEQEVSEVAQKIEQQNRVIASERRLLSQRLVSLYQMGGVGYLRILLDMDPRKNPFDAISMLSYLVTRDARVIADLRIARRELAIRTQELASRQMMIVEVRKLIEQRRAEVTRFRQQKEALVASLRSESTSSAKKLVELQEKERRLGRLFSVLYRRNAVGSAATDIRGLQGALQWPAEGKVVEEFGKIRSSKFSTFTVSNGVTIRTAVAAPVHAVFQGTVLYAQWFKGYGNLIIVDHGNRVFTLYGNTRNASVSVGDRVTPAAAMAVVAEDEENASAGSLYFEVRQDNKPEDPRTWLR